jgi:predicted secreted protein
MREDMACMRSARTFPFRWCAMLLWTVVGAVGRVDDSPAASITSADRGFSNDQNVVTELENDRSVAIARRSVLSVRLETSPGTGYSWLLVRSDPRKLPLIGEALESAERSLPGGTTHKVFRFRANRSGTVALEFHYVRRWEKGGIPKNRYRVEVRVD